MTPIDAIIYSINVRQRASKSQVKRNIAMTILFFRIEAYLCA